MMNNSLYFIFQIIMEIGHHGKSRIPVLGSYSVQGGTGFALTERSTILVSGKAEEK